jgi:EAL domain-containing protein (putative c-di-GMP-specific phosphodiesterase class I)
MIALTMAYLKRFAVQIIKIDRVFIDGFEHSPDSEAIVNAIIAMSHALGKSVIAEGVETEKQLALLRKLHCDEIQGYLVSKPLPAAEFAEFLRNRAHVAASA